MLNATKNQTISPVQLGMFFFCIVWIISVLLSGTMSAAFNGWMLIGLYAMAFVAVFGINDRKPYPFVIFLLYCFLSNAGQTLTHLLGIPNVTIVDIYKLYSSSLIGEMLFWQGMFVACMTLGYMTIKKRRSAEPSVPRITDVGSAFQWEDVLLLGVALAVFVTYLVELSKRASLSYGDYYYETREGLGTVMQYVYHTVMFGYLMRHEGRKRKMGFIIAGTLAVMAIFIGSRSAIIPLLVGLVYILLQQRSGKLHIKLRYIFLVLLILIVMAAFTQLRDYALSELSFEVVFEAVALSPFQALIDIIHEMGASARTVLSTMVGLELGDIRREGTILYSMLKGVFPIGMLDSVGITAPTIESLSAWVSDYGSEWYIEGKGWGYSIIGEILYNFGGWGALFSLLFGAVMGGLENLMDRLARAGRVYLASGILYVLGYSAFWARAESTLLSTRIRYTVYMAIAAWMLKSFIKPKGATRHGEKDPVRSVLAGRRGGGESAR